MGFPGNVSGKEPTCQCRRCKRDEFNPWVRKIPSRRAWQPTPVFLPEESHGQRSPAGYRPQGCKELNTAQETQHICMHIVDMSSLPLHWEDGILCIRPPEKSPPSQLLNAFPNERSGQRHQYIRPQKSRFGDKGFSLPSSCFKGWQLLRGF